MYIAPKAIEVAEKTRPVRVTNRDHRRTSDSDPMPPKTRILVTGASGFIGAHVVNHLLQAGYAVRGTCRSTRLDKLQKRCIDPNFEAVVVDDFITGDLTSSLKGVNGVVHVASPLPLPGSEDNFFQIIVEGTLNLLRHAHASSVYRITLIGSIAATDTTPQQHWNTATREDAVSQDTNPSMRYRASKTLAEQAAWEFAESHLEIDLTTLLPPFVYGPLAPAQIITNPASSLSTNIWIYMLLSGKMADYPRAVSPRCVDVRDVARAAVLSFSCPAAPHGVRKRILLWGGSFTWSHAVEYIALVRPELKHRLVDGGEPATVDVAPSANIDTTEARTLLGLQSFIGWKRTVEDTVDSLLARENTWMN
ncbi:hypothetical protein JB92DRAFT_3080995 [Gautieria morchelliformis]|nr:hypothetical protein JB92DRAFT_3080995 [Gautieria morchelliformis]